MRRDIATAAGVDALLVTIAVAGGSVVITATIAVPASTTAAKVMSSLSSSLGTAAAASAVLGVTIESAPTVALAEPPSPSQPPASGLVAGEQHNTAESGGDDLPIPAIIGAAVGAAVLLVGTLLGVAAYRRWWRPGAAQHWRRPVQQRTGVLAVAGEKSSGAATQSKSKAETAPVIKTDDGFV